MKSIPHFAVVAAAFAASNALATQSRADITPDFHFIARPGDPFPGRPGAVYDDDISSPFSGPRFVDPNGDIFFHAQSDGPGGTISDVLVYRRATRTVEPYVRNGEPVDGLSLRPFWGVVGGAIPGAMGHYVRLGNSAGSVGAIMVSGPGGERTVAAREGDIAPGQTTAFTRVGTTSGEFLDVNFSSTGVVAYGGRFMDQNNTLQYGYYLTRPGGSPERIVDSTMAVPDRPDAVWANTDNLNAPFERDTPGLDAAGNAYFRAKYTDNGVDYRAFYRRNTDGTITAIADAGSTKPIPGQPDGYRFARFSTAANNQFGDVAFAGAINNAGGAPVGTGIYRSFAGGSLTEVFGPGDPIPVIPEANNALFGLSAMNDSGHLLITANYTLNGLSGQSLVLTDAAGNLEPVLLYDQTPGFPGERAGLTRESGLNSRGDAVFVTRMNTIDPNVAAFAYLNDIDTLIPILKTGDILDGLTVVDFNLGRGGGGSDPMGAIGAAGGPTIFDDARNLSLLITLEDDFGELSTVLYAVQVPAPGAALVLGLGGLVSSRRRR